MMGSCECSSVDGSIDGAIFERTVRGANCRGWGLLEEVDHGGEAGNELEGSVLSLALSSLYLSLSPCPPCHDEISITLPLCPPCPETMESTNVDWNLWNHEQNRPFLPLSWSCEDFCHWNEKLSNTNMTGPSQCSLQSQMDTNKRKWPAFWDHPLA